MFCKDAQLNASLEEEFATGAFTLVRPAIEALFKRNGGPAKRDHMHVVMATRNGTGGDYHWWYSWKYDEPWEHPYDLIAEGKMVITDRTGLPSRAVQLVERHLLVLGDVKYWGSAIRGPRMVSASGVQPYFDELISQMLLDTWCALAEHYIASLGERVPSSNFYPTS